MPPAAVDGNIGSAQPPRLVQSAAKFAF